MEWKNMIRTMIVAVAVLLGAAVAHASGVVLFDEGHGQKFLVSQQTALGLSGLASLFKEEGYRADIEPGPITREKLALVDALVISGAFAPLSGAEIAAIGDFVRSGGSLCIMLHIGVPVRELLAKLGAFVSKGVVRDEVNENNRRDTDLYVAVTPGHDITQGINGFRVYGGWALASRNEYADIIASTSDRAWIDTNMNGQKDDAEQQRSLALAIAGKLGAGRFVVFGDDAIFQNQFLSEENEQLARNLAKWMMRAKKGVYM